jgi:hypothetical protein
MKVLLETRCGCSQIKDMENTPNLKAINLPLIPVWDSSGRSWYRVFEAVGVKDGLPWYREVRMSPVWTWEEIRDNSGPADIL